MIPRIGYHFANKNQREIQRLMYRGYRFVWFLGVPVCLGMIMVSANFIPWFYGDGCDKVISLLRVLCFLVLAIGINMVTGNQYLIPTGQQNLYTITVVVGACVNVTLNYFLISFFQSIGAAVASVIAETTIAVVQLVLVRKELSATRILHESIHYWVAGGVMAAIIGIVGRNLTPSITHSFFLILLGGAMYFTVLFVERDDFFIENVKLILRRVCKQRR